MEINQEKLLQARNQAISIADDLKNRRQLSLDIISVFKDHKLELDQNNGRLHTFSSKVQKGLETYLADEKMKNKFLEKLKSNLNTFPLPSGIDANQGKLIKEEIAALGLSTLMTEIKAFNLNQETTALKKANEIKAEELADSLLKQANELREQVAVNRENHQEVRNVLGGDDLNSLDQAAKLINPDGKDYNKTKDQEIDDFLNGGDLIL